MATYGDVLFRRGNKSASGSEDENNHEDIWDDEVLIKLYDKALKVAHEQVAKRIAMSTNSATGEKPKTESKKPAAGTSKNKNKKKVDYKHNVYYGSDQSYMDSQAVWTEGAFCRATYSEDNNQYEATILEILDDHSCTVYYLGYGNEETVLLKDLEPSWGEYQRVKQSKQAALEMSNNAFQKLETSSIENNCEDIADEPTFDPEVTGSSTHEIPAAKKVRKNRNQRNASFMAQDHSLPPLPAPGFPAFPSSFGLDGGLPNPPPMPFLLPVSGQSPEESQALSTMLISWYMSGYYTGLYQGQQSVKKNIPRK